MILYVLFAIVGFVVLLFLESFSLSLFGFSLLFVVFLFFYKIIDLKLLLIISAFVTLFLDVVLNIPLGSTFLSFLSALFFYRVLSLFLSTERGFFSYIFKILAIFFFYIASFYIQRLFTFGNLGYFEVNLLISSSVKAFFGLLILSLLDNFTQKLRGNSKGNSLKFK